VTSDPRSLIRYAVLCTAAAVALLWALYLVRSQLLLIYICALFATGLAPLVRYIERHRLLRIGNRRLPRPAAIGLIYATVIGILAAVVAAATPPMVAQGQQLWKDLPERLDLLQNKLVQWGLLAPGASFGDLLQKAPAGGGDAVTTVLVTLWGIVGGLFGLVTILLLTFYLLLDAQGVYGLFVRLFPRQQRTRVSEVSERVAVKISAWLGGQVMLGFIIGVTSAIGLWVMGVPYFFVLAVISGIGEMIPMVGPLLSAVPAIAVAFTVSPGLALGVAVFFMVQQMLENNVLVPKVMGEQVGLSAVTVISALVIGSALLGFVGALLAVPTAAIIQVLFEELVLRDTEKAS
jgi:predicted PurR-regulated permease PerM